jgi:NADPH-dependent curcumin reductase CurA
MTPHDVTNKQWILAARPIGTIKETDFRFSTAPVSAPKDGQILVRNSLISIDPAMRSWMNAGRSYMEAVRVDDVMRAAGAGYVVQSKDPRFKPGDAVTGLVGVQEYALLEAKDAMKADARSVPLSSYLNLLGLPGFTAYFGLLEVGQLKQGETVLVSGAAGAVGSAVGQIAKVKGCRVVGIAGGSEKCKYLTETLGFDAAVDYKSPDVRKLLAAACPDGVDVYFDNVGGAVLDLALARLRLRARIVICGAVSQYNTKPDSYAGPKNYMALLMFRARMEGFVIFDYEARYPEAQAQLREWLLAGKIKSQEDITDGLEAFPSALARLFEGANTGKMLVRLRDDEVSH